MYTLLPDLLPVPIMTLVYYLHVVTPQHYYSTHVHFHLRFAVEDAGGKCLPCIVDVRDEKQVEAAVNEAVKVFGGIDVLVNNASAISLTGTLDTPMKKYDLMNGINARGTYLWLVRLKFLYLTIGIRFLKFLNILLFHHPVL